jgi:hypothetical protein
MPQLHFYVSEEVAQEVARRARAEEKPVSRWVADLVQGTIAQKWPEGYESLFGSLGDDYPDVVGTDKLLPPNRDVAFE